MVDVIIIQVDNDIKKLIIYMFRVLEGLNLSEFNLDNSLRLSQVGENIAKIKVIGVGGGGCNAVNRMVESNVSGIQFIAVNTDYQVLEQSKANNILRIGEKITRGLGAGMDRNKGASAANESRDEIADLLKGADMVFVTAGMGGGTGTGAAPVIAQISRDMGILTVAVVTKPFGFEGASRKANAEAGLAELEQSVDSIIVVPNDKLIEISDDDMSFEDAFSYADQVLKYGVAGISDLISIPGLINLDLNDIRRVMSNAGLCHMGIGRAAGQDRIKVAIEEAIHSPLLDTRIDGAHRVIINFTGDSLKIKEIEWATTMVRDAVAPDADIIVGAVPNPNMTDEIMVTVIASCFEKPNSKNTAYYQNQTQGLDLGPNTTGKMYNPRFDSGAGNFNVNTTKSVNTNFKNNDFKFSTSQDLNANLQSFNKFGNSRSNSTIQPALNNTNLWNTDIAKKNPGTVMKNNENVKEEVAEHNSKSSNKNKNSFINWLSGDSYSDFEE